MSGHFSDAGKDLYTVRDHLRFAVSCFNQANLFFGHGSNNAYDEAAYLILHTLHLPLDRITTVYQYWDTGRQQAMWMLHVALPV